MPTVTCKSTRFIMNCREGPLRFRVFINSSMVNYRIKNDLCDRKADRHDDLIIKNHNFIQWVSPYFVKLTK